MKYTKKKKKTLLKDTKKPPEGKKLAYGDRHNVLRRPSEQIFEIPFFINMMNRLKKQGFNDADAYRAVLTSPEWDSFSYMGDGG